MKDKKRLYRSCEDRLIAGVCGGLSEYFEIDASIIRLIFSLTFFAGGAGLLIYLVAWIIIPSNPNCGGSQTGAEEIKEKAEDFAEEIKKHVGGKKKLSGTNAIVGAVITLIGVAFLLENLFGLHFWQNIWPIIIIVIGLIIVIRSKNKY
jgi:phage shock protein PspC (stress-responsive transcriptional regulator)